VAISYFFIGAIGGYGYWYLFYWRLLMTILLVVINGYFIMAISGYSINGYWWLFYSWLLVVILLMVIGINGYSISGY
jgi:hypothetical protein